MCSNEYFRRTGVRTSPVTTSFRHGSSETCQLVSQSRPENTLFISKDKVPIILGRHSLWVPWSSHEKISVEFSILLVQVIRWK